MWNSTRHLRLPSHSARRAFAAAAITTGASAWRVGRRAVGRVIDLMVPAGCPLCGAEAPSIDPASVELCVTCTAAFAQPPGPLCPRCAAPRPPIAAAPCPYCRERRYCFEATQSLGYYRGAVRQAVLWMKYGYHEPLTLAVGGLLWERIEAAEWRSQVDLVAPVPLHLWKRITRGTSAPELLAEVIGRRWSMPVVPRLLVCRRRTRKQGLLLPNERLRNVRGAFELAPCYDITNARILLVDDVMTTGATANEAARELLRAGAAVVRVATVARGTGEGPSGTRAAGSFPAKEGASGGDL